MQENAAGGSLSRKLSFLMLAGLGVYGLSAGGRTFRFAHVGLPLLGLFAAWACVSVLWSVTPAVTVKRLVVWAFFVLGACGVARLCTPREIVRVALVVTALVAGVGLFAEFALGTFRPWTALHRFCGTLHPNHQALNLATLVLAGTALLPRTRARAAVIASIAFACGLLLLTRSRTALAGVLLSLAVLSTLSTGWRWKLPAVLFATTAVAGGFFVLALGGVDFVEGLGDAATMGRDDKQVGSLTGRLPIWAAVAPYIAARPLLGWGHDSFWTPYHIEVVSEEVQWGIRESHSAYIDTLLSTGLVGLTLALLAVVAFVLAAAFRYVREAREIDGFLTALFVFAAINAFTESAMSMPGCVPFVTLAAMLSGFFGPAEGPGAAAVVTGRGGATLPSKAG